MPHFHRRGLNFSCVGGWDSCVGRTVHEWRRGHGRKRSTLISPQWHNYSIILLPCLAMGHGFCSRLVYQYNPGLRVGPTVLQILNIKKKRTHVAKRNSKKENISKARIFYALPASTVAKLESLYYPFPNILYYPLLCLPFSLALTAVLSSGVPFYTCRTVLAWIYLCKNLLGAEGWLVAADWFTIFGQPFFHLLAPCESGK